MLNEDCKKQGMYNAVGLFVGFVFVVFLFFSSPHPNLTPSL